MVCRGQDQRVGKLSRSTLERPRRNKAAILWEGEPGDKRTITYQQLHRKVCKFANVLKRNNIGKGDRVIIYMPTIPEAAIAMLACARIGAVHSVVFGGFSADSIRDRIEDCGEVAVITADGGYRRGAIVPLKRQVDEALHGETTVRRGSSFSVVPETKFTSRKVAMSGGIASWNMSTRIVRRRRSTASIRFILVHERLNRKTERNSAHDRRLSRRNLFDGEICFRSQRQRCLLVHSGRRVGDGAQLCCLRSTREWRDDFDVRRRAELAGARPFLAHRGRIRRQYSLHRADGNPLVYSLGR